MCPITIRTEARIDIDAFLVLIDNEHNSGPLSPAAALAHYRAKSGIPARLIYVGMTATDYSIADGRDPLCVTAPHPGGRGFPSVPLGSRGILAFVTQTAARVSGRTMGLSVA